VALDVLLHLKQFISERLSHILGLEGEASLELGLLLFELVDLLLVELKVVLNGANHLFDRDDLALDVCCVGC